MRINKNGSWSPAPISLYKNAIPSKIGYKAVFRGFMFCVAESFIKNPLSLIVWHSDSLTAHITIQEHFEIRTSDVINYMYLLTHVIVFLVCNVFIY